MKLIATREGWQCKVSIYKDYVIKEIKNREEIRDKIRKYLIKINKLERLEKLTEDMIKGIRDSTRILKNSNIPLKLIAESEFIDDKHVKQKRARVLYEELERLVSEKNIRKAKEVINVSIMFYPTLWGYGIHDKTFKFTKNLGIIKGDIVLLDLFELTNSKIKVASQLRKTDFNSKREVVERVPTNLQPYLIKKLKEELTIVNLNRYWKTLK